MSAEKSFPRATSRSIEGNVPLRPGRRKKSTGRASRREKGSSAIVAEKWQRQTKQGTCAKRAPYGDARPYRGRYAFKVKEDAEDEEFVSFQKRGNIRLNWLIPVKGAITLRKKL